MAHKQKLFIKELNTEIDGYAHNDELGLALHDGLWHGVHIRTGQWLIGPKGKFKRKRSCLAFIEALADLDWSADSEDELYERNNGFEAVKERYSAAVLKGEVLE